MRSGFCFLLVWFCIFFVVKADESYIEIADLRYQWMEMDYDQQRYTPYLAGKPKGLYFTIDANEFEGYDLRIKLHPGAYIYINDRMQFPFSSSEFVKWDIDSLVSIYNGKLSFYIYGQEINTLQIESLVTYDPEIDLTSDTQDSIQSERQRPRTNDYLIILGVAVFAIFLGYRTNNYRLFSDYFNLYQLFRIRQRFDVIVSQSLFSSNNLSYLFLYGILVGGGVYTICQVDVSILGWELSPILTATMALIGSIFFLLCKYPLLVAVGLLFQTRKMLDVHYMMYVRYAINIALLFFVVCFANGILDNFLFAEYSTWCVVLFAILLLFRLSMIFVALNSRLIFYKLHLFAYLCSTEIFPLILFIKYLHH